MKLDTLNPNSTSMNYYQINKYTQQTILFPLYIPRGILDQPEKTSSVQRDAAYFNGWRAFNQKYSR